MTYRRDSEATYIDDARAHNPWWDGDLDDLQTASALPPRSDLHRLLERVDDAYAGGRDERVFGVHGQTGVGKTTLLHQIAGTLLDEPDVGIPTPHLDLDAENELSRRQILYLPFEASLYQLEEEQRALEYADVVYSYFSSRVAEATGETLVLLDDVGALGEDPGRRLEFVQSVAGPSTVVLVTGNFRSQVAPTEPSGQEEWARPERVLPLKFIDIVKIRDDPGLGAFVERHQSSKVSPDAGESLLAAAKRAIRPATSDDDSGPVAFARYLEKFYYEALEEEQRQALHRLGRSYLRTGGFPGAVMASENADERVESVDREATDPLLHSRLLLFLYKELAEEHAIDHPKKLHHLCSLAAAGTENVYGVSELSERLNVDRRTIQNYVEALEAEIVLTESTAYSLRRHREKRFYLRDPRHVTLLSRRHEHEEFGELTGEYPFNPGFERQLARTAAFDHAKRLAFSSRLETTIEYSETDAGVVEYVLRAGGTVFPFALGYEPRSTDVREALAAFDPTTGTHVEDGEQVSYDYRAPLRFNICDTPPLTHLDGESLIETIERGGHTIQIAHVPLWLFMLCA